MKEKEILQIDNMIYLVRGHRVMLDSDLAKIYGVETKRLKEQVKRNLERFPDDFMFQLTFEELSHLGLTRNSYGGQRYLPYVFTENGVAMLSSVLNSATAIQINISIIRTFTKLRSFLSMESSINQRMDKIEIDTNMIFKILFEKLDTINEQLAPTHSAKRKIIGLKK